MNRILFRFPASVTLLGLGFCVGMPSVSLAQDEQTVEEIEGTSSASDAQESLAKENTDSMGDTTASVIELDPYVVVATRTANRIIDVPSIVDVVDSREIQEGMYRTLPDVLRYIPGVMVQKTGYGQGSPYIRGFTGYRNLLLIDGIRLNNSVFRDGPNQYWNTIDPYSIERLEVLKGPSSVLYGSDAIGGTVAVFTNGPKGWNDEFDVTGRTYGRVSTAESSYSLRGELSMTINEEFGAYAGGTWKDFGDLRTGGGTQPYSGYDEWDVDSKVEWRLSEDLRLVGAYQQVNQNEAWRTHKTVHARPFAGTTVGNELKRSLDQTRQLGYLQLHGRGLDGPIDGFSASLSYQQQTEQRDRIRSDGRRDLQGFDVGTFGTWAQFMTESEIGRWTYGVEYYHDSVGSHRRDWAADGTPKSPRIQGPVADDAAYDLFGAYVQDEIAVGDQFEVVVGARYTWARADAKGVADPVTGDRIRVTDDYQDVVGSLRGLVFLDQERNWNLFGGFSQGFRAPNLSDLTRFDSARSDEIETPSPGLSPERFNSFEAGMKFGTNDFFAQGSWYWTTIEDMIIRQPTGRIIDGDKEVTKRNGGSGYVQGVDVEATWKFQPGWAVFGSFAWVEGEGDTYPTSAALLLREPLSRLMPTTGQFGVRWNNPDETFWVEGLLTTAASQDQLSTRDKADTQRIPPDGTPGYTVASVRLGWQVNWNLALTAVFDNITDKDYRVHGSGSNEPGFNFIFGAEVRF